MSYTTPEAVRYFSTIGHRDDCNPEKSSLQPRQSKISRIATNQLQYKSLKHVVSYSSNAVVEKERKITLKNHKQQEFIRKINQARTNPAGSMLEQIARQRGKLDLPLNLDDLKYGTRKLIGDKDLTHLNEKLALCKK